MVGRAEGYEKGAPKEERGLLMAEHFYAQVLGVKPLERVEGIMNFFAGDHVFPSGRTMEVKRQPIHPDKYGGKNFIEAFEVTGKDKHADGWRRMSELLKVSEDELKSSRYHDGFQWNPVPTSHISPSLITAGRALGYVYTNPDDFFLYVCRSVDIRTQAREAFKKNKLTRGRGNSNDVSFAFRPPIPPWRWQYTHPTWTWIGDGDEKDALDFLRGKLG